MQSESDSRIFQKAARFCLEQTLESKFSTALEFDNCSKVSPSKRNHHFASYPFTTLIFEKGCNIMFNKINIQVTKPFSVIATISNDFTFR